MLREKDLIWQVGGLDVCWRLVEGRGDVGIDCLVGGEVESIVDLLLLDAVVLPVVLFSDLLKFDHADIRPSFHLLEKTVIVPRASFQLLDLFLGQSVFLSWLWVDDDIGSTLEDLLSDLIIAIVVLWLFGDDSCLGEGEDCGAIFD